LTGTDEPGHGERRAKSYGLVRPYVLNAGGRAHRRPTQREAGERLTRGDRPALDWTGDLGSQRAREAPSESTRHDGPTRPPLATARLPLEESAGNHRVVSRGKRQAFSLAWPGPLGERRWLAAIGGVAALAIVGGLILFLSRPSSTLLADACRAGDCRQGVTFGGAKPPGGAPASTHRAVHGTHPTATSPTAQHSTGPTGSHPGPNPSSSSPGPQPTKSSPAPTSPRPTPTTTAPSASPTPSPTSTSSPAPQPVQVSYTLVRQHPHSFQDQFTIVNNGNTAINGWELVVVLPHDRIRAVWNGLFHTDGDALYIDPSKSQQTIAPGGSLTENVTAHGSMPTPTSCTFNGSPC
jgi:hypothetical protein